jgi:UDP-N-acetylmuramyl tripeptide synthase
VAALATSSETFVVLETDEAWLPSVMAQVTPDVVVLLNLSRDQLDRSSEVRVVVEKWRQALHHTNATVVANAADPLVAYAAVSQIGSKVVWVDAGLEWTGDARSCPQCTEPLNPEGEWRCDCGFARPHIDYSLGNELEGPHDSVPLALTLPGRFNRANAAMAVVAAAQCGVPAALGAERVGRVSSVAGRFTLRRYNGRTWRLLLAKNPAGVAALIDLVRDGRDVVVAINDRVADGFDPSWLYDAPFDRLRGRRVWCTGDRALDVAARLDYAEVEYALVDEFAPDVDHDDVIDVVANYTAFAEWIERSEPC